MSSKTLQPRFSGPSILAKNYFDEMFLKEKDKALSPIFLDDKIVINKEESEKEYKKEKSKRKKTKSKKKNESANDNINRKASFDKYESNIVFVDNNDDDEEDNKEEECPIVKEVSKLAKKIKIVSQRRKINGTKNGH